MTNGPERRPLPWRQLATRFKTGNYWIDPKFSRNRRSYALQSGLVVLTMLVVLLVLDTVYQGLLIAALGASSVAAFSYPTMRASRPRCLIGGYLIAILVGGGLSLLIGDLVGLTDVDRRAMRIIVGAFATGLTMFGMAVTDTEHPSAAAVALGFVLNEWDGVTVLGVMSGISAISVSKEIARNWLIDLT